MTAAVTREVPASMKIGQDSEGVPRLDGFFPSLIIMHDRGDGEAERVGDGQGMFFLDGSEVEHTIVELPESGSSQKPLLKTNIIGH